jgi:putative ABC transport system substrate-binding protein
MGHVGRRRFAITAMAACVAPRRIAAQPAAVPGRIGYLALNLAGAPPLTEAFRRGLRELGYTEGRNLRIEFRDAAGAPEQLLPLAAELAALPVDVIVTAGAMPAIAARQATPSLPIVFIGAADPVSSGLVASLAQPGGNATGLSLLLPELIGKRLELFKEAVPTIHRIAVLWQPGGSGERTERDLLHGAEVAARALGLRVQFVEARTPADIEHAFSVMTRAGADALIVLSTPMFGAEQKRLVGLAARHRLPGIFQFREYVVAGGLMSYGPDLPDLYRRAALYVDKILNGVKPGSLPVEQPTKFELVINLRTAQALGLALPVSLVGRADELIR